MVLSMQRWKGKVAVVTGAGGGMGEEIVKHFLDEGLEVVAIDKRPDSLTELAKKNQKNKSSLHCFPLDISQEGEVAKLFKRISAEIGLVHILINAAGIVQQTPLIGGDVQKWRKVLDTNVLGLCITTSAAAKIMKDNKIDGHIVHISSYAGYMIPNIPDLNLYPASKYAVRALTETLRLEINQLGLKIRITSISPGAVDTKIQENNDFIVEGPMKEMVDTMPKLKAADIAGAVVYALSTPPHVQVQEIIIKPVGEPI